MMLTQKSPLILSDSAGIVSKEKRHLDNHHTITCTAHEHSTLSLDSSVHLSSITLMLEEDAHCTVLLTSTQDITFTLAIHLIGPRASCTTKIGLLLKNTAQANIITYQIHTAPETKSDLLIKSVNYDSAQTQYTGTITIHESAPQSNAQQNSYALLLSPEARAYAHPALEALTHDVQCGHGAAVASLDLEHLFYLQSKGLGKESAEQLIIQSFLSL